MAHRMVNEGGINQAMLLHLSFHNKWLSLGKPKQIRLIIRAFQLQFSIQQQRCFCWCLCNQPARELIPMQNNPARSSKPNQTFPGHFSSSPPPFASPRNPTHTCASSRRGTATGTGAKVLLETCPKFSSLSNRACQEPRKTGQLKSRQQPRWRCSSSPGTGPPALQGQPLPPALLPWEQRNEAERSRKAPVLCSLSWSNCCLPAAQPSTPEPLNPTENDLFFCCRVTPRVLFLSAYWNGSAERGGWDHSSGGDTTEFTDRFY